MAILRTLLILCCCLGLSSCDNTPQNPMRIGTSLWPGYEPFYLANHMGLLPEDQFRLVEYPSTTQVIRAFRNNTLDAAVMTLDEVLVMAQDNLAVEVILVLDHSTGANVIIAQPQITEFDQLKGKTLAVEANTLGAYLLNRALTINQITEQDINIIPLDVSEHHSAFIQGKVDAVITSEPVRTKIKNLGANELFSTREIFGEVYDVLVIKRNYLRDNRQRAKLLTDGWFKALHYFRHENDKATAVMSARMQITPSEVINSYRGLSLCNLDCNTKQLDKNNGKLKTNLIQLANTMKRFNLLNRTPTIDALINDNLISNTKNNE